MTEEQQLKWDIRFLSLAAHHASWSKDPSTKVGAVLAKGKKQISEGYNGFASSVKDTASRLMDRSLKYPLTIHAEHNAVLTATQSTVGATCYVWPIPPCAPCAAILVQHNVEIARVVSILPSEEHRSRWEESFVLAREAFDEAGVEVVLYDKEAVLSSLHWYRG